jgi:YD repeat-containing protein
MEADVCLKRCVLVLVLGVLCCVFSPGAAAQNSNPCLATTVWFFPLAIPVGWAYYGPYPGTFAYVIWAWKATCPAPGGGREPKPECPRCGKPISLANGNTYIKQTDVNIPGISGGLTLKRTWNSEWPSVANSFQVGLFGPNWTSTYDERIFLGSDNRIRAVMSDGGLSSFGTGSGPTNSWTLAAPQNEYGITMTAPTTSAPYWQINFQNGEQKRFDGTSGMLTSIIDRNGNTTSLTYDSANRLATVTDPASRHLYFGYGSSSSHLVTSVTSDVGISLSYTYDTQGRLTQVTNPDLSTLSFAYNSQSLITAVTDANGKILESHTYDSSGRGLTSSRAGGVEAVTLTYP